MLNSGNEAKLLLQARHLTVFASPKRTANEAKKAQNELQKGQNEAEKAQNEAKN